MNSSTEWIRVGHDFYMLENIQVEPDPGRSFQCDEMHCEHSTFLRILGWGTSGEMWPRKIVPPRQWRPDTLVNGDQMRGVLVRQV